MNASIESWAEQIRAGDIRAVSRALSAIENGDEDAQLLLRTVFPSTGRAWRIGITGAAGSGKSTLASCLAAYYRTQGKAIGIIAVDPTSPFTGGAILGDRIRMQSHFMDEDVFIRSMALRGSTGGLAQAAADAALLLDAAGKDIIILETVGVGQDEIEIVRIADCTLVVVVSGAGDEVQGLKAGLMEIADIFVLNKSDYEDAGRFEQQLLFVLQLAPPREGWNPKIVRTVATEEKGIAELAGEIDDFREAHVEAHHRHTREIAYWKHWLVRQAERRVAEQLVESSPSKLDELASSVASREKDPYSAAEEILRALDFAPRQKNSRPGGAV
jgi:LAO/AO transport system kinase